jgi:D-alanyl-D-alanine carboxypeptidase
MAKRNVVNQTNIVSCFNSSLTFSFDFGFRLILVEVVKRANLIQIIDDDQAVVPYLPVPSVGQKNNNKQKVLCRREHYIMSDDSILNEALATGICLGLPGVSVSIGNRDGILWSGADGYSEVERRESMHTDNCFCIGSITKTFVAVVILQLVDEGKIKLEKTVLDYIPQDSPHHALVSQIPNTATATLSHLLCHQSGIPTWEFESQWIRAGRGADIVEGKIWDKAETLQYLVNSKPTGKPGECFSYSNTNYTLLGLVIENVTGNGAASEIRKRILVPLGLKSAYLDSFEEGTTLARTSHYHFATKAFVESAGIPSIFQPGSHPYLVNTSAANLSTEWTAGGMIMNMSDLVTYTRALRDGKLLSDAMKQEMFTYRPPTSDQIGDDSTGTQGKSLDESGTFYCQGICHKTKYESSSSWGHGGLTLGFSSRMLWLEDQDVVLACATNIGLMHSGFGEGQSPWDLFVSNVLLPAVKQYVGV